MAELDRGNGQDGDGEGTGGLPQGEAGFEGDIEAVGRSREGEAEETRDGWEAGEVRPEWSCEYDIKAYYRIIKDLQRFRAKQGRRKYAARHAGKTWGMKRSKKRWRL
jgi:hypothetical protein